MAFAASLRCVVIVWVAAAFGWRWREVNVTSAFTSVSKIQAVYKAEHESPEIYGFELNSYQLLVSLGKSYSVAGVNITFICVIFIGLSAGIKFSFFVFSCF